MARLAITKDVLSAFAKLDKRVQGAVEGAIAGFANGHQAEAHLEKVPGSLDDRIRLLRLDGAWYGAVLVPDSGDTYCLLTILPLNEAVSYATSHRIGVNQATGVLEVSNSAAIQEMKPSLETAAEPNVIRLFADVSDAELTRLGIDAQVRPLVRLLVNDTDLDALQAILPEAQYTALHALASGMTVDEALAETAPVLSGAMPSGQVHGDDLVAAMERTPDQVAFVSGQEELQLILAHPFAAWRTFLHPSQREIAYRPSYSGPAQVTGGPGTGKTVTVLHRAAFLAARAASAGEPTGPGAAGASAPDAAPILLTTFNGNLADALQAQADLLIRDPVVRRQIQVRNVDRLAYSIVKEARGTPVIADERVLRARWTEAAAAFGLDLTPAFLKNEWEQVILAQDLRNEQAYLTCLRTGRGRPLTKAQRSLVWQAAQQVTAELAAARQSTHLQLANEATHLLREAGAPRYRHILVDEAQDLHPAQWRLLRAAVRRRPGRPVHRGRPAPAHLQQPGLPGQPADQRAGAEPEAVPELPDHPGDPGLGDAPARLRSGHRPGRRDRRPDRLPLPDARPAPAAAPRRHPRRGIRFPFRTDPLVAGGWPRAGRHRDYGQIRRPGAGGARGAQSGWPRHHLGQRPGRYGGRPGRHHARHEGPGVPGRRGDRRRGRPGPGPGGHHRGR